MQRFVYPVVYKRSDNTTHTTYFLYKYAAREFAANGGGEVQPGISMEEYLSNGDQAWLKVANLIVELLEHTDINGYADTFQFGVRPLEDEVMGIIREGHWEKEMYFSTVYSQGDGFAAVFSYVTDDGEVGHEIWTQDDTGEV